MDPNRNWVTTRTIRTDLLYLHMYIPARSQAFALYSILWYSYLLYCCLIVFVWNKWLLAVRWLNKRYKNGEQQIVCKRPKRLQNKLCWLKWMVWECILHGLRPQGWYCPTFQPTIRFIKQLQFFFFFFISGLGFWCRNKLHSAHRDG